MTTQAEIARIEGLKEKARAGGRDDLVKRADAKLAELRQGQVANTQELRTKAEAAGRTDLVERADKQLNQFKEEGWLESLMSIPEVGAAMVTELPARAVSGIAGLVSAPFVGSDDAAEISKKVQEALAFPVTSREGQELQRQIAELPIIKQMGEFMGQADVGSESISDIVFEQTGSPALAAGTRAITGTAPEVGSLVATRGAPVAGIAEQTKQIIPERVAKQAEQAAQVVQQAERLDIPVMTTDVFPPETWLGKLSQNLSAKLGVLGTGTARASQQQARNDAVKSFMDNAGIEIDSPFADQVVNSLNAKSTRVMNEWMDKRSTAKSRLSEFGKVPVDNALRAIDAQIKRQENLGAKADQSIITDLNKYRESIEKRDFSGLADIRSEVIKDLQKFRRGEDIDRKVEAYQPIKSAIDKDMAVFSRRDAQSGKDWREANRNIASELDIAKNTEMKRILNSGEATPEIVIPYIRGGKPSQLKRLYASLGKKGRDSVKNLIVQDALQQAKFFNLDDVGSPDALATRLSDPSRQKAIKVFFDGKEPPELAGVKDLVDVLNRTRLAQQSPAFIKTGDQVPAGITIAGALGGSLLNAPVAIGGTALASGLLKAYESPTFRNLLIRIGESKNKPTKRSEALELAIPFALVGLQAAIAEQEQEQLNRSSVNDTTKSG